MSNKEMTATEAEIAAILGSVDESIEDDVLESFLKDEAEVAEVIEITPAPEVSDDDVEAALSAEEARIEAHEEQNEVDADPIVSVEKATKVKRVTTAGMLPSEALSKMFGDDVLTRVNLEKDIDTSDADILLLDGVPKKVKEKIINVFSHLNGSSRLSVYTAIAIEEIASRPETTITDIKNRYLDHPYSIGTASAQSSQMMSLLPALGIAERSGKNLTLIEDSPVFAALIEMIAAASVEVEVAEAA